MSFAKPQRAKREVINIKGTNTCLETKDDDFTFISIITIFSLDVIYLNHKFFPSQPI